MASDAPARPALFHVQHIPATFGGKGVEPTRANWRITDVDDNRVATCYDSLMADRIVAALNGSALTVSDYRAAEEIAAANDMLDNLEVPPAPLLARIGLALLKSWKRPTFVDGTLAGFRVGPKMDDPIRADPLADGDRVTMPNVDALLPKLLGLSGEDAFRLFDSVKLLENVARDTIQGWNFTDANSVRGMVRLCCSVALETGRMSELAKAVDEHTAARAGQ